MWNTRKTGDVKCTLSSTSEDGLAFRWSIDNQDLNNKLSYASTAEFTIQPKDGWHAIYAQTEDGIGNLSGTGWYHFGVGLGGLISPADGDRTQGSVALTSSARPEKNGVTYQYRYGTDTATAWANVPAGDITIPGTGSTLSGWPFVRTDTSKDFTQLDWNVIKTLSDSGKGDGAVQVRSCYTDASTGAVDCADDVTITVERTSFGASKASREFGPGTVALQTGDFAVDGTDVSIAGLSVERGHTTLSPSTETGPVGVFGPGWRAGFPNEDGEAGNTFEDHSADGYVQLKSPDGATLTYVKQNDGTFEGTGDAADGEMFVKNSATKFTHTDATGVTTVFTYADGKWGPDSTDTPGAENEVTYVRDALGRVTNIIGRVPEGVTCTASNLKPGCAALRIVYSSDTTATGVGSGWGRYNGTVQRIEYTAYDPAAGAMKTTVVSQYIYDSTGHLRQQWDPRISPSLETTYYYNDQGRLSQITPPGQAPWQMAYDNSGRLAHVTRTDSQGRAVTQAVAYNLPITGSNAPIDLSGTATAAWSQTSDLPVTGAAIFPASHVPARGGDGYYQPGSGDWKYADLSYLDVNGRTVNTASFGSGAWQANATRYDKDGRIIWALTAENRARALTPTSETDPYVAGRNTSAERADLLATVSTYNSSGDVITTTGPTRRLQLDSGTTVSARDLTENTYDEGRPDKSIDYHLVTTSKISPLIVDGAETPTIADSRVAKNGYAALAAGDSSGWELRNPTSVTKVMASGTDLITRTRYDRAGRVVETRQPASDGTDAGTTVTVFYTADTNPDVAACGLKPQWAGQICQTGPKAQPTGKTLPAETRSYGYYGQTTKAVETSGGTTRTTISTYDDAGRPTGTSLAVTPSAEGGQSVPESTTTYNQSTGLAQSNSAGGKTITTAHDSFGRVTSYADGTGNTATTTYTVDSQIATVNDGKGTYTYTYDGNDRWDREEHRGLVTQIDAGLPNSAGVIRSGYNGDGKLTGQWQATAQTWSVRRYDARGEETALGYGGGDGSTWLWFSQGSTVHGQTAWQSGPAGTQDFLYDNAGRLKKILDRYQGQCNVRT